MKTCQRLFSGKIQEVCTLGFLEKLLIKIGIIAFILAATVFLFRKIGIPFGKLPGDIHISRDGFEFWFPITTCLVLSGLISGIIWLLRFIGNLFN
ncbi:DUF2905 domain-containing protein [Kosmotoga sp. DU53]|uniref:DUF2905 domain-containing protein n=1 Tax=Kosmotoga sp. DU53 TaxID=1310160 RepID=UPI000AFECBF2|nr:DUF2905 domain-containing protein [Kosmotoga sp. DU53]